MRNADRFIRVIYTEASLSDLLIWKERVLEDADAMEEYLYGIFSLRRPNSLDEHGAYPESAWCHTIEKYLHLYPKNYNEEEVDLLLGNLYKEVGSLFRENVSENFLFDTLYLFPFCAKAVFEIRDGCITVKHDSLLDWYGLFNKADPSLFYAAFLAEGGYSSDTTCTHARYHDKRLDHILRKGYAENHLHLKGGGYCAEINWHRFLYFYDTKRRECLNSLRGLIESHWRDLSSHEQDLLMISFQKIPLIRKLLIMYVYYKHFSGASMPLEGDDASEPMIDCITDLLEGLFLLNDVTAIRLLEDSEEYQLVMDKYDVARKEVLRCDPQELDKQNLSAPKDYWVNEQGFLRAMFEAFLNGWMSPLVCYAFNSYIVAYIQFKQGITQDNSLMGFRYFKRAEDEKEVFIDIGLGGNTELYKSMFHRYYNEGNVKYIEFRSGPKTKSELISFIDKLNKANEEVYQSFYRLDNSVEKIDFGIIVHFIKDGKPDNQHNGESRKSALIRETIPRYKSFVKFFDLEDVGGVYTNRIVGIDAANYEIGTRPEVYGPLFRKFTHDISSKHNTGITYHVGEDFVTLCNGLRAIDDAVEFLELGSGDRIGHGTALGLDADLYFKTKRGRITTTIQEHVDDLAWLHSLLTANHADRSDLITFLECDFNTYIREWYTAYVNRSANSNDTISADYTPTINAYMDAYWLRGNDPERYVDWDDQENRPASSTYPWECSSISERPEKSADARYLYLCYQYDGEMKKSGSKFLSIEADLRYIEALKLAQIDTRKKILERGISIETNPSSNWKISSVSKFIDLQTIHLNQHNLSLPEQFDYLTNGLDIPLTINTDNGGIFQTNLATEYAYMLCAMKEEGFNPEEAYEYIDYLRDLSLAQSFVPNIKKGSYEESANDED